MGEEEGAPPVPPSVPEPEKVAPDNPSWMWLLTFVATGVLAWNFALAFLSGVKLAAAGVMLLALTFAAAVDARAKLLPDWPAVVVGLSGGGLGFLRSGWEGLGLALLGGVLAGAGLFLLGRLVAMRAGREALGLGDVKYAAAGGLLLGPMLIWTALSAAAAATLGFVLLGALVSQRKLERLQEIPFGPALLGSIWLTWMIDQATRALPGAWWPGL